MFLALIALPLAGWRSWTAHQQARTANKQHLLSEVGLMIDRFQRGAQMLESDELSVRLAGVYVLRELAASDPDDTYLLVLDLLCDFIRENSKTREIINEGKSQYSPLPHDLQKALENVSLLRNTVRRAAKLEQRHNWRPDFRYALFESTVLTSLNLSGANLRGANLANSNLDDANLTGAILRNANLSGVTCRWTKLNRANLHEADLTGAFFNGAILNGANFSSARLKKAVFGRTSLADTSLISANLANAVIERTEISDARLDFAILKNCKFIETWSYEKSMPDGLPDHLACQVGKRKEGEDWGDFVDRMVLFWPEVVVIPTEDWLDFDLEDDSYDIDLE
ncbi:uncharacterized protein YjbI with pentapeptide repeats [Labrenzia sp. EL_159]|nr:uncharacterized protein YjbI with pentapeptide repeats [Labrenzia sp. EL_162]MBG6196614.1 uncharacterized protein YjbI with pentapeptide repeats [Labrenzia sp. EL_159]